LVWSAAGVCPWPPSLHFVHRWIDRPHHLIEGHGLRPHLYADDTQIQGACHPGSVAQLQSTLSTCLDDVPDWMRTNRLQLNTSKTEILWCTTSRRQHCLQRLLFTSEQTTCCRQQRFATWPSLSIVMSQCGLSSQGLCPRVSRF